MKKVNREEKKENFLKMIMSVNREQLSEFVKLKGKEPKKIKPFICLNNQ